MVHVFLMVVCRWIRGIGVKLKSIWSRSFGDFTNTDHILGRKVATTRPLLSGRRKHIMSQDSACYMPCR